MAMQPATVSPAYLVSRRGLIRLHALTTAGTDQSPEADIIRDGLDAPWNALSIGERERLSGLSEDLYSLTDPISPAAESNPQAHKKVLEAFEAKSAGEWDRALAMLRRWGKYLPAELLAYIRGSIWLESGDPQAAAPFLAHASQLSPDNAGYHSLYLACLEKTDAPSALRQAIELLKTPEDQHPSVLVRAAGILFSSTRVLSATEAEPQMRVVVNVLTRVAERLNSGEEAGESDSSMVTLLLGFAYEHLEDWQNAVRWFDIGLMRNPYQDALLVARGINLYGRSDRAVQDFERAVRMGSPVVWPYFFLAHHYISHGRYEDCRKICERGLEMPASPTVRAEFWEWLAIAQAESSFPHERVRAAFEQALLLDASNERIRRNATAFESALKSGPTRPQWDRLTAERVREFGRAEQRIAA